MSATVESRYMDRPQFLETLCDQISARYSGSIFFVGIDGVDGAGKTTLADELKVCLEARSLPVARASIDGFHNPREYRTKQGNLSPEGYYQDSFDYAHLIEKFLIPARSIKSDVELPSAKFDFRTDSEVTEKMVSLSPSSILVFEGVFLFRPELEPHWDFKIFVDIDEPTSLSRGLERDSKVLGGVEKTREKYQLRYIPGQRLYKDEVNPQSRADIVIDNRDPSSPVILNQSSDLVV